MPREAQPMKYAAFALFALAVAAGFAPPARVAAPMPPPSYPSRSPVPSILACSAMVEIVLPGGVGFGSCVAFENGATYCWTNWHVVAPALEVPEADVWVVRAEVGKGRKTGEKKGLATIVAASRYHDLALLRMREAGWPASGAFDFSVPTQGDEVYHVGAMHGRLGLGSLSRGIVSAVGRLRTNCRMDDIAGVEQDQACLAALPGSSGGGVFRVSDGACVGLVTEFLGPGHTPGIMCLTPARRMLAWAKEIDMEHALDARVKPPKTPVPPMAAVPE